MSVTNPRRLLGVRGPIFGFGINCPALFAIYLGIDAPPDRTTPPIFPIPEIIRERPGIGTLDPKTIRPRSLPPRIPVGSSFSPEKGLRSIESDPIVPVRRSIRSFLKALN